MIYDAPPMPLPDPPPGVRIAYMHWTSFYRAPFRLYVPGGGVQSGVVVRLLVAGDPTGGRTLPPAAQSPYRRGEPASPATNSLP